MSPREPSQPVDPAETPAWTTDPAMQPVRDLTGTTLGDFHVERLLGRGGMGEVYLATQVSLNRPAALKLLRPDLLANPNYLVRFEAEAWAAAKLNHPNIVHIYTLGCVDGLRYIAMEYVQGTNLREYIEKKGPPELPLALSIMRQSAQAVGAAGELGLVHRDIKPENLLLTRKGQVKVADFGLCRDKEGQNVNLTLPGVTMGTPLYMSPEQVQGHSLDHRSDLYSLGVTFYHMLSGSPPFRGETALALALKHVRDKPVSLAIHRPDLPPELVKLVMKLMAKSVSGRYASAAEMLKDLSKIKGSLQNASAPVSVSIPEAPAQPSPGVKVVARKPRRPFGERLRTGLGQARLGRRAIAAAVLLSAVLGGLGGWWARAENLLGDHTPVPETPPGLWMAAWNQVAPQRSGEEQYRFAQIQAPPTDLEAAFLAVPGRFPQEALWRPEAYTQLIRILFRHHDAKRLAVLADELEHEVRQHEEKALAPLARAAAAALQNDVNEVLDLLDSKERAVAAMSEGVAELGLEIVLYARMGPGGKEHPPLNKLAREYMKTLKVDFLDPSDLTTSN
jgi:eukaryotic-like serine/threonine-protein kinase